jgi:hypothetical protein
MKKMLLLLLIPILGIAQNAGISLVKQKLKNDAITVNDYLSIDVKEKQLLLKNIQKAINYQNTTRSYFEYQPLSYDEGLTREAQKWADYLAVINIPQHSTIDDKKGELIFYAPTKYFKDLDNLMTYASVFWTLSDNDINKLTTEQILCRKCSKIGFGIASSRDTHYVVAKYDKMSDFNN